MVYVKCNEDGTYKSSVDKFYDQDDLSAWAKNWSTAGDMICVLSGPADKTRTQCFAYGISYTFGIEETCRICTLWVVDFPLLELTKKVVVTMPCTILLLQNQKTCIY
jgi:aspartyl-tRNA synthetase